MTEKTESENNASENLEMPEHWKMLPLEQWVNEGYKPRVKKVHGNDYLIIRKGKAERSLGRFSQENWDLLHDLFPKLKVALEENVSEENVPQGKDFPTVEATIGRRQTPSPNVPRPNKPGSSFLGVRLNRPTLFPKTYMPSLKIVRFYEVYREEGGTSDFSTFINDIVETHLRKCHGYMIDLLPIEPIES